MKAWRGDETILALLFWAAAIWLLLRVRQARRAPRVPRESLSLLEDVQPPSREEIERYVPEAFRDLGADWSFTRGKVLTFSEREKTRWVGSVGGFDVARSFGERYCVYRGTYGFYDHRQRLQTFRMPPTENERLVRPGRAFLICFDRRSPRVHHVFPLVRQAD